MLGQAAPRSRSTRRTRGYCATDLNGHSGFRTPQQGAEASVRLATLDEDGPTGTFWGHLRTADGDGGHGALPW